MDPNSASNPSMPGQEQMAREAHAMRTEITRLHAFINRMSRVARIGTWEVNVAAGTLWWSDHIRKILEVPPDFVPTLENGIKFFVQGYSFRRMREAFDATLEHGAPYDIEVEVITGNGRRRWVRAIGEAEMEDGRCVRAFGVFQDIHDQILAREAITTHETNFRDLFLAMPVGIAMSDFNSSRFLEFNAALADPTGYSADELFALSIEDLTPEEYREEDVRQRKRMIETGRFGPYKKEFIHRKGRRYPVLVQGFRLVNPDGRDVVWSMVQDLSNSTPPRRVPL